VSHTPPIYKVVWLDSGMHIDHGWASRETYLEQANLNRMEVVSVGMLMDKADDTVALGFNYDPQHDTWIGAQLIARQNIISMEELH